MMADVVINGRDVSGEVLAFAQELVRIKSFSGQEEQAAKAIAVKMGALDYDEVRIDRFGNFDDLAFAVSTPFHFWLFLSTYPWYYFRGALPEVRQLDII
jgi:hypothetical protein